MASTVLFVVMAVIAGILLLTASLGATIGAADSFASPLYNTDPSVRAAHQYLTIAAALGWSALVTLIIILIVAAAAGGFSTIEVADETLLKPVPSTQDVAAVAEAEKELSAGRTTQIVVLVVLIILAIVTFIVGVLAAIGAVDLGGLSQQDVNTQSAYTAAIVAAVAGIGGIAIMFIAVFTYVGIRSAREEELGKIHLYDKRVAAQLRLPPPQAG
jgi:hypothetical protein